MGGGGSKPARVADMSVGAPPQRTEASEAPDGWISWDDAQELLDYDTEAAGVPAFGKMQEEDRFLRRSIEASKCSFVLKHKVLQKRSAESRFFRV